MFYRKQTTKTKDFVVLTFEWKRARPIRAARGFATIVDYGMRNLKKRADSALLREVVKLKLATPNTKVNTPGDLSRLNYASS